MAALDLDKKMRMEVDASDYATEEVLSMEREDGKWRLVAFLSKSLNETERNYWQSSGVGELETLVERGAIQV